MSLLLFLQYLKKEKHWQVQECLMENNSHCCVKSSKLFAVNASFFSISCVKGLSRLSAVLYLMHKFFLGEVLSSINQYRCHFASHQFHSE